MENTYLPKMRASATSGDCRSCTGNITTCGGTPPPADSGRVQPRKSEVEGVGVGRCGGGGGWRVRDRDGGRFRNQRSCLVRRVPTVTVHVFSLTLSLLKCTANS